MITETFNLDCTLGKVGRTDHGASGQAIARLDQNADLTREQLIDTLKYARLHSKLEVTADDGDTPHLYQGPIVGVIETSSVKVDEKSGIEAVIVTFNWRVDHAEMHQLIDCSHQRVSVALNRTGKAGEGKEGQTEDESDPHQLGIADGVSIASLDGVNDVNAQKLADAQIESLGDLHRILTVGNRFEDLGISQAAIKALRAKLADLNLEEPTPAETPAEAA